MAVSTAEEAVAIAHGRDLTLVSFTGDGHQEARTRLGRTEFLVAGTGDRYATHDAERITVRAFADQADTWNLPLSESVRSVATAALDARGETVAIAGAATSFMAARSLVVA